MIKTIILCTLIVVISAFTSAPVNINYYSLNTQFDSLVESNKDTSQKPLILLEAVQVAEFLRQQGIVVETGANQLHMSSQHRWAEKLDDALSRHLINQLENKMLDYRFENHKARWNNTPKYRINISFSHFHSSANRQAVVAGQYWILDSENKLLSKQRFQLAQDLRQSGYPQLLVQLNHNLTDLVDLVVSDIQKLK